MSQMKIAAVVVGLVLLGIIAIPFLANGPLQGSLVPAVAVAGALIVLAIKGIFIFALAYLGARLAIRHERGVSSSIS